MTSAKSTVSPLRQRMLDGDWLFPGLNPVQHLSARQLNRAIHAAADEAGIDERISMHSLRHTFATHLLEQKVDIRLIQVLLGHKKLETTALYAQVATDILREVVSLQWEAKAIVMTTLWQKPSTAYTRRS